MGKKEKLIRKKVEKVKWMRISVGKQISRQSHKKLANGMKEKHQKRKLCLMGSVYGIKKTKRNRKEYISMRNVFFLNLF